MQQINNEQHRVLSKKTTQEGEMGKVYGADFRPDPALKLLPSDNVK